MEVSRRRTLQKHLEPARPLRRCLHVVIGKQSAPVISDLKWWIKDVSLKLINYIINCSPMKNLSLCRISYSRDFLIALANCAESRRKPEFLPDKSISFFFSHGTSYPMTENTLKHISNVLKGVHKKNLMK
uniref:Uncharacterized protein n=1 Tax=Mola mola TaxID=94237 RepID=A0A3Q3VMT8_MOLML